MGNLTSLILHYREDQQEGLTRLLKEFREKTDEAGINMKVMDLKDF